MQRAIMAIFLGATLFMTATPTFADHNTGHTSLQWHEKQAAERKAAREAEAKRLEEWAKKREEEGKRAAAERLREEQERIRKCKSYPYTIKSKGTCK